MTGFRKLLLNIHLWLGLIACLLIFMLGLTGAILVFEYNIDRALNPGLSYVRPQAQRLPLDQLVAAVKQQYPKARISGMGLSVNSPDPGISYSLNIAQGKDVRQVFIDQYTGRILGSRAPNSGFAMKVHQLHTNLLAGPNWNVVTTWATVFLAVLALSGIYLWWPRKIFGINLKAPGRRINFDLHNAIGFYTSIFVFLFAITGIEMHWETQLTPAINFVTRSAADEPAKVVSAPAPPGTAPISPISLDKVVEISTSLMPGARVTQMTLPGKPNDIVRVWMKYPEDNAAAGRTWIYLDQFTGKVLWSRSSRTAPLGTRYVKQWNREIHTGDLYGLPSRIIAFLASLSVSLLALTGPLIWILKKTKKKAPAAASSQPKSALDLELEEVVG